MDKRFSIHGEHSYCEIVNSEYLPREQALRVIYVSDSPSEKGLREFIGKQYPELSHREISRFYFDKPWHYRKDGVPYALVLIFFK